MSTQEELEAERFLHRAIKYLQSTFPDTVKEMKIDALHNAFATIKALEEDETEESDETE